MTLRIAIIGSGVSGLAALWSLKETEHEVHLYESQDYFGGHSQTVEWKNIHGEGTTNVDIAFTLFNRLTYPNFTAFISHLRLPFNPLRVTFGLSRNNGNFQWSSTSVSSMFTQRRNIFSPKMWRMLFDIFRFNAFALGVLSPSYPAKEESVSTYLSRNRYSQSFQKDYLVPLVSSLWVHDPDETLNSIPVIMLVRYLYNHCLLNSFGKPLEWLVIEGGAKRYVDTVLAGVPSQRLHKSTPVQNVHSEGEKLVLRLENGKVEYFDRVIMATHAPDALNILGKAASFSEAIILSRFRTSSSTVVLHSDISKFMPRNRKAWAAWNYHDFTPSSKTSCEARVSLTANLNSLPNQDSSLTGPILTTLNPCRLPDASLIQRMFYYRHPIFDNAARSAQDELSKIQGDRGIWFAGAWMGYGFHEDGFRTGVEAARGVWPGIRLPFEVVDWKTSGGKEEADMRRWDRRILRFWISVVQRMILFWILAFGVVVGRRDSG